MSTRRIAAVVAFAVVIVIALAAAVIVISRGGTTTPSPATAAPVPQTPVVGLKTPVTHRGFTVDVEEFRSPARLSGLGAAPSGTRWSQVRVRTCTDRATTVNWYRFSAADSNGNRYPALIWSDKSVVGSDAWSFQQYPTFRRLAAGACAQGWLLLIAPREVRLTRILDTQENGDVTGMWRTAP